MNRVRYPTTSDVWLNRRHFDVLQIKLTSIDKRLLQSFFTSKLCSAAACEEISRLSNGARKLAYNVTFNLKYHPQVTHSFKSADIDLIPVAVLRA